MIQGCSYCEFSCIHKVLVAHSCSHSFQKDMGHSKITWTKFCPFLSTHLAPWTYFIYYLNIDNFGPPTHFQSSTWFLNDPMANSAFQIKIKLKNLKSAPTDLKTHLWLCHWRKCIWLHHLDLFRAWEKNEISSFKLLSLQKYQSSNLSKKST